MDPSAVIRAAPSAFMADPLSVKRDEADDALESILSSKKRKLDVESGSSATASGTSASPGSSGSIEVVQPPAAPVVTLTECCTALNYLETKASPP